MGVHTFTLKCKSTIKSGGPFRSLPLYIRISG